MTVVSNKSDRSRQITYEGSRINSPDSIQRHAIIFYRGITFRDTIVRDGRNNTSVGDTRARPKWYLRLDA